MFSTLRLAIPKNIYTKWQSIIDDLTKDFDVPVGLIMRTDPERINVFISSQTLKNPYKPGDSEKLEGLYCNAVMESNQYLMVKNAIKSKVWRRNPDIKLGMICYLGYPLNWPNKKKFGTVCILDRKERLFTEEEKLKVKNIQVSIEKDLEEIFNKRNRKQ